jgi:hypothetical protein
MIDLRRGTIDIIAGTVFALLGIGSIFVDQTSSVFFILFGLLIIISGLFINKGYYNKTYYLAVFSTIGIFAGIIIYMYLFMSEFILNDLAWFYTWILAMVVATGVFIYQFMGREKNENMPWKSEW